MAGEGATCYFLLNYALLTVSSGIPYRFPISLAIFFWIMPVVGSSGNSSATIRPLAILTALLFSFELCSLSPSRLSRNSKTSSCYFLLNYARTWRASTVWESTTACYFLLNYARFILLNALPIKALCKNLLFSFELCLLLSCCWLLFALLFLLFSFELCLKYLLTILRSSSFSNLAIFFWIMRMMEK